MAIGCSTIIRPITHDSLTGSTSRRQTKRPHETDGGPPNCCCSLPGAAGAAVGRADGDVAAVQVLSVHVLDGPAQLLVVLEVDKAESAGSSRLMVDDDLKKGYDILSLRHMEISQNWDRLGQSLIILDILKTNRHMLQTFLKRKWNHLRSPHY